MEEKKYVVCDSCDDTFTVVNGKNCLKNVIADMLRDGATPDELAVYEISKEVKYRPAIILEEEDNA